ncbi:alpha/beta hydrolase [Ramlibacter sp. AN1133]|uniref:alpha/beta hydrolase n=1 Tax=Ramlibacter sp. AN1133 TaxID=3133429 RepID=UPI0030C293F8
MRFLAFAAASASILLAACSSAPRVPEGLVGAEHRVRVVSTAPALSGQEAQLYLRELAPAVAAPRGTRPVVLFVHGAGTPAEVSFDSRRSDYSWLAHVAQAGFDVFAVDMTGYGRSTRPPAMNDPCNVAKAQQARFVPMLIPATCDPSHPTPITTMASDWRDIDAVVDFLRALRGVERVSMVGWSQGGPRIAGYAALHPGKVERIVVLAPAYSRNGPLQAPDPLPRLAASMTVQSRADFIANWDRQVGCPAQYEAQAAAAIFDEMLESDPTGAKWGEGVRRAPSVPTWGFNQAAVARLQTPFLMVAGEHDKQVDPKRVRELYEDWGGADKVFVDLGCSSHNAMWEKNRRLLYQATVDWLREGKVDGMRQGVLRMGY